MTSAVLEIQPMSDERLYVIGDIHGCYDELMALESKIRRSAKRSKIKKYKIISVGDLCDRGPDTKK
jgi:serine/threonine protein phosphatase 1